MLHAFCLVTPTTKKQKPPTKKIFFLFVILTNCINLRLPQGADLQHISSALSDGVLSVETRVSGTSMSNLSNEIVVPVQIKQTEDGEK